jgi:hypothetical protein
MVNTEEFIARNYIDYYGLNAPAYVQRSSLSHLLSGRNKPSLDFILKILDVFPDVDLYWMINEKVVYSEPSRQQETKLEEVIKPNVPAQFQNLLLWNLFLKKSQSDKK